MGGANVSGKRCILVDDVISAGTAIREAKTILDGAGAALAGVIVALDRQERTGADNELSELSAIQSEATFGVPVLSIINLDTLLAYLEGNSTTFSDHVAAVRDYRKQYGVAK